MLAITAACVCLCGVCLAKLGIGKLAKNGVVPMGETIEKMEEMGLINDDDAERGLTERGISHAARRH